jgi:hypothetical protein
MKALLLLISLFYADASMSQHSSSFLESTIIGSDATTTSVRVPKNSSRVRLASQNANQTGSDITLPILINISHNNMNTSYMPNNAFFDTIFSLNNNNNLMLMLIAILVVVILLLFLVLFTVIWCLSREKKSQIGYEYNNDFMYYNSNEINDDRYLYTNDRKKFG